MRLNRNKYLNDLIIRMHNGLIKVITGLRRCGKSYLLNEIFYEYLIQRGIKENHIIKFAFDSANDLILIGENLFDLERTKRKVDPEKFVSYINKLVIDNDNYYLLLDEIQNLGSFESVLNGYLNKKNLDIYVTGSNSKFLSTDVITEFAGRGDEIHLFPLSFKEFMQGYKGDNLSGLEEYSLYGGLPSLLSMTTDEQKSKHLINQVKNTYLRDIIVRNNLHTDSNVGELLDVISSGISSLTSPSKLEASFKSKKNANISRQTINKYIEYFINSFLISKTLRYDIKGKNYINTPFKLYFEDIGIRNARLNFRQIEQNHIMENIIYNELRMRGFNVDVGVVATKEFKNNNTIRNYYEVDFVANLGNQKYYIQSAYDIPSEKKWEQETASFNRINDSFKKIVVVKNNVKKRYDDNGYFIINLLDFLLDENSLNF